MSEKRITILSTTFESRKNMTLPMFARAVLTERTDRSWRRLRNRKKLTNTVVHEIRVAVRRAEAALVLFTPLLPHRIANRLRKRLRQLRRRLGSVRNLDVFLERCLTWTDLVPRENLASLILAVASERRRAARNVRRKLDGKRLINMRRQLQECLCELRCEPTAARPTWPELLAAALEKPLAILQKTNSIDLADFATLHGVRLACKRLRYLCELAAEQSPSAATEELVQRLRAAQQRFGNVNDSVTAVRRLEQLQTSAVDPETAAMLEQISRIEQTKLTESQTNLQAWWQTDNLAAAVVYWKEL